MKGDVHDPGKYRGITLLSQVLKLLERVLDGRIRKKIECEIGEEQQGFRKERGTTDGLFTLRQSVEKKLEKQGSMCIGCVDLEKRNGDGNVALAGSARSRGQDGGGNI